MVSDGDGVEILAAGHLELPRDLDLVAATAIRRHPLDLAAGRSFQRRFEGFGGCAVGRLEWTSNERDLHGVWSGVGGWYERSSVGQTAAALYIQG